MPEHHLPHEVLVEYAAGASDPGHALIVACHLTLCPVCRREVAELEMLGGALVGAMDESAPASPEPDVEALVRATLGATSFDAPTPSPVVVPDDPVFPRPLVEVVGTLADLKWRTPYPGVDVFEFDLPGAETTLRMTRVKPGYGVPTHTHEGLEMDLVLAGGLHDRTRDREFERGDIQSADPEVTHELKVLPGEPCIVLTSNLGGIKPVGLKSRMAYRWLGWT